MDSETTAIAKVSLNIEGIHVALYDTPGLNMFDNQVRLNLQEIEDILKSGIIHLVIFCVKLTDYIGVNF